MSFLFLASSINSSFWFFYALLFTVGIGTNPAPRPVETDKISDDASQSEDEEGWLYICLRNMASEVSELGPFFQLHVPF